MVTRVSERFALVMWIFSIALFLVALALNTELRVTSDWLALLATGSTSAMWFWIWRQRRRARDGTLNLPRR